jgi:hypothetical protein
MQVISAGATGGGIASATATVFDLAFMLAVRAAWPGAAHCPATSCASGCRAWPLPRRPAW